MITIKKQAMLNLITKSYRSEIQDIDEKGIVIVAANAFGNKDAHGDISEKGSFAKTINEGFNRVRWYRNHNQNELLGLPMEAMETDRHLVVKGKLNLNKQLGRDTYEDYKMYAEANKSLEHSVGVIAMKRDEKDKARVKEWRWLEYSTLTNWGANPDTPMLSIKSESDTIEDAIAFMEECLRKANYSDDYGKKIEEHVNQLKALISSKEPSGDTLKAAEPLFDINEAIKKATFF
jgi:HK97 family phage prohead protease